MSSVIKVNQIQDAGGNTLMVSDGSGNITTNNFKDIDWQAVVTSNTTMVAGKGYFVDSSGGTITVTLPASPSVGDTVAINALNGQTNAVTVARNSSNIEGGTVDLTIDANYGALTLIYSDASNGWVRHNNEISDTYIIATGGTATTSGDYKIHTFNSSSNFVVSNAGNQSHTVDYLVVAGGGGGGWGGGNGGGGGAGGMRYSFPNPDTGGTSITAQTYPITVGAGGTGGSSPAAPGGSGSNSVFSTITSTGGGGGGSDDNHPTGSLGGAGGSGGGAGGGGGHPAPVSGGAGNTPPVSPSQGNPGGLTGTGSPSTIGGAGGGGHAAAGADVNPASVNGGNGGAGTPLSITGSATSYAGGGGGGADVGGTGGSAGSCGGGRGGDNNADTNMTAGTANTGGGGGGNGQGATGAAGGSGVVIIRYKYQG